MNQEILDKLPIWMQDILKLDAELKANRKPIAETNKRVDINEKKHTQ